MRPAAVTTLDNGVRVAVVPRPDLDVVAVAVAAGVGSRDEPEGRSGFAHLFEHLMFSGGRGTGPCEYARRVHGFGGRFNAATRADCTVYHSTVPADACRDVLALEADRFTAPEFTPADLLREIAVVTEEVGARSGRRAFGRFPMTELRERMFGRFANRHDGATSTGELQAATLADSRQFFAEEYTADRLAIVVVGGPAEQWGHALVREAFGKLPHHAPRPARPLGEPGAGVGRHVLTRPGLPADAVALGYRVPDPLDLDRFLPLVVLAEILGERIAHRPVDGFVSQAVGIDLVGDPLGVRDPTGLVVRGLVGTDRDPASAADALQAAVAACADGGGNEDDEVASAAAVLVGRLDSALDDVAVQAVSLATRLWCSGADDLHEIRERLRAVTAAQVCAAAVELGEPCRIELVRDGG